MTTEALFPPKHAMKVGINLLIENKLVLYWEMPNKTVPVQIIPFLKHQGQIKVPISVTQRDVYASALRKVCPLWELCTGSFSSRLFFYLLTNCWKPLITLIFLDNWLFPLILGVIDALLAPFSALAFWLCSCIILHHQAQDLIQHPPIPEVTRAKALSFKLHSHFHC